MVSTDRPDFRASSSIRQADVSEVTALQGWNSAVLWSYYSESECSQSGRSWRERYAAPEGPVMHQHPRTEEDRRVALGWIGRQLAWENRLQTLRDDPAVDEADDA